MYNYVLIPGAWLGGWVWRDVEPYLVESGHKVFPITLTGMGERVHLLYPEIGMDIAIEDVLNVIRFNDLDNIVLVGHSFAGKVAAAVADRIPEKIRMVIYLDSFSPDETSEPQGSFAADEFGKLPEGAITIPLSESILQNIAKDVEGHNKQWILSKCTPWPVKLATDPIKLLQSPKIVKNSYIFCDLSGATKDEIAQKISRGYFGNLYGPYRLMETGHYPMITKPLELANHLLELPEC